MINHLESFIAHAERCGLAREDILNELRAIADGDEGIYTERAKRLLEGYYDSGPN